MALFLSNVGQSFWIYCLLAALNPFEMCEECEKIYPFYLFYNLFVQNSFQMCEEWWEFLQRIPQRVLSSSSVRKCNGGPAASINCPTLNKVDQSKKVQWGSPDFKQNPPNQKHCKKSSGKSAVLEIARLWTAPQ